MQLLPVVVAVGLLLGQSTPPAPTTAKPNLGAAKIDAMSGAVE